MLLPRLLAALARGRKRTSVPEHPSGPQTRFGTAALPAIGGYQAFAAAVASLSDSDTLDAFLALPAAEQLALVEREIERLSPEDRAKFARLLKAELKRAWLPLPGPQTRVCQSTADIILMGGAGGGGKTDLLLGLAMTEHRRSLILRRQYTDLSAIVERMLQLNKGRQGYNGSPPPTLRTADGRLIELGAAQHAGDEEHWQGRPHDFVGFDEAAQFLESQVRYLMGWVRSTDPGQRTRVVLASNPPLSDEGQWLVAMFRPWLDPGHERRAAACELRWFVTDEAGEDREVDGPGPHLIGGRPVKALSRTFIPARLADNPYLAETDYAAKLDALQEPLRSAIRDGNFMAVRSDDAWQVIPSDWVRAAQARWMATPPAGKPMTCLAADVAQGGTDQTVLATRYGTWFAPLKVAKGVDTPDGLSVAGLIFGAMRDACQVVIDAGGGYGGSAIEHMHRQQIRVEAFNGAGAGMGQSIGSRLNFANRRAEVWWRFREALDPNGGEAIALPPDADLLADLCTPRLNARAMQLRGVIQVESKEDIRARLGRSPDRGDAVVMCHAHGGLLERERAQGQRPSRAIMMPPPSVRMQRPSRAVTSRPRA